MKMIKVMKGTVQTSVKEMFPLNEENRNELQNRNNFAIKTVNTVINSQEKVSAI